MGKDKDKVSKLIKLESAEMQALEDLARDAGFQVVRGIYHGQPNVTALASALARASQSKFLRELLLLILKNRSKDVDEER